MFNSPIRLKIVILFNILCSRMIWQSVRSNWFYFLSLNCAKASSCIDIEALQHLLISNFSLSKNNAIMIDKGAERTWNPDLSQPLLLIGRTKERGLLWTLIKAVPITDARNSAQRTRKQRLHNTPLTFSSVLTWLYLSVTCPCLCC